MTTTPHPPAIRHCGRCGEGGVEFTEGKRFTCGACGWTFYQNPAAAVVAVLEVGDRVVLTRRNRDPGKGLLDLPGGFVDPGETAEETLARELGEELGLNLTVRPDQYLGSLPNIYHYQDVTYRTTDLFYRIALEAVPGIAQPDEIQEVVVLGPEDIEIDQIALDSIREGIRRWVTGT